MPKLDEDDFVDPGNLPQIAQSKSPTPPGFGGGFGSGGFGSTAAPAATGFGNTSPGGFGSPSSGGFGNSVPSQGFATAANNNTSTQAAGAMHNGGESTVALDKDATDWINKKWRPVMGWVYMLTCTMDFVIFPILWSLLQALSHGSVTSQWQPLTLQGAGLYHIAMGAVLGIAAYGRTKEKVEGKAS
jgi:hypothetical protein